MDTLPLPASLRTRSARLARWTGVLLAILVLMLLTERFGAVGLSLLREGADPSVRARLGAEAAAALPEGCCIGALWWIRAALLELASGVFHTPILARALRRVGTLLALGAALALFAVPSLQRLAGADPGYLIAYDIGSIALCVVGVTLAMLAQVLERAGEVQSELDGMF
ncbi:DUF2975 domain-containing protein [Thermomonas brevis]|uniref:DUF2975 domain-containing protein n=1 Tax=Thermomonas brevis TaxID=215691 RepID=A0A7G9QT89_9GAMM|nr:DUF2975 domain-containing protein [Thermomonas brevis]QNN46564.1 DUF2975 domain-containing protein [Thermomonas brevis]